jgi:hypothetical protein
MKMDNWLENLKVGDEVAINMKGQFFCKTIIMKITETEREVKNQGDKIIMYHVTTDKKVRKYHQTGHIKKPVRGFLTLGAAISWAFKSNRNTILKIDANDAHKLPDHHQKEGEAWWNDGDIFEWEKVRNFAQKNHY